MAQSCPTFCSPMHDSLPGSLYPWNYPGNTEVCNHSFLQGMLPDPGTEPGSSCILLSRFFTVWATRSWSFFCLPLAMKVLVRPDPVLSCGPAKNGGLTQILSSCCLDEVGRHGQYTQGNTPCSPIWLWWPGGWHSWVHRTINNWKGSCGRHHPQGTTESVEWNIS